MVITAEQLNVKHCQLLKFYIQLLRSKGNLLTIPSDYIEGYSPLITP